MNGNESREVEAILRAASRLVSPGDVLYNVAQIAFEVFGQLDYAAQRSAADRLALRLKSALWEWKEEIAP